MQWWFKITIDKEKSYLKESQPDETRRIPFNNGGDLSEPRLTGITELGTFMVFCEFPQPYQYIQTRQFMKNKKVYTELCYYIENSILVAMATTLDDERMSRQTLSELNAVPFPVIPRFMTIFRSG